MTSRDRTIGRPTSLVVQSTVRPKRVAFLFDADRATLDELDSAIIVAAESWGGAFWPFVPFTSAGIEASWWQLLEAADPDVLCPLHEMSAELTETIVRRCAPMRILRAPTHPNDRQGRGLVSSHQIGALRTTHVPAALWAEERFIPTHFRFLALQDKGGNSPNRTFALRNFGLLTKDIRFNRSFDDLPGSWLDASEKSPKDLLAEFAMGGPITPFAMTRFNAEPPFLPAFAPESQSFWLIVGDSPMDLALARNSSLAHSIHMRSASLWLSKADALNPEIAAAAGRWAARMFLSSDAGAGGFVLSYSEPPEVLETVVRTLNAPITFTARHLERTDSLFGKFQRPLRPSAGSSRIQQVAMRGDEGRADFVRPVVAPLGLNDGGWMVDLEIEHPQDPSFISSNLPVWKVPRRAGVASAFAAASNRARVTWERIPTFEVAYEDADVRFQVPTPDRVFFWCLVPNQVGARGDIDCDLRAVHSLEPSDAGLQLRGVLNLFGGLMSASVTLENPFWRDFLTELAGRPDDAQARHARAIAGVLKEGVIGLGGQIPADKVDTVSDRIAQKAWRLEAGTPHVELTELPTRYNRFVGKYRQNQPHGDAFAPDAKFDEDVKADLDALVEAGILLQGVSLRCDECFTPFWLHVDQLRREATCPGCLSGVPLPANPAWSVRANELVSRALRRSGVLPVIHALHDVQRYWRPRTFTFVSSRDVLKPTDNPGKKQRIGEIDVLVLVDGRLLIGEVKSTPKGFDQPSVDSIVRIAMLMHADEVMFAAEDDGGGWPAEVHAMLERAKAELSKLDITGTAILLGW